MHNFGASISSLCQLTDTVKNVAGLLNTFFRRPHMNNLSICQKIIKGISELISSSVFLDSFRLGNHFTRRRKIDMRQIIIYLFYHSRNSMDLNIAGIRDDLPKLNFPAVSKQALSKARTGISPALFRHLFHFSVHSFYNSCAGRKDWHGYFPFAIDGSRIQVPTTKDNLSYFGRCRNGSHSREDAMASISILYDVCNDIVVDGVIHDFNHGERSSAMEHLLFLEENSLTDRALILCDRGYPSYELFSHIQQQGYFFLMRVQKNIPSLINTGKEDAVIDYVPDHLRKKGKPPVRVRVLHIMLEGGSEEWLVSNLVDLSLTPEDFSSLYFKRWKVEGKYREFKSQLEIERFHGARHECVEQEFYLWLLFSNLCALLKSDADAVIEKHTARSGNSTRYQADRAYLIGRLKKKLPVLLLEPASIFDRLRELLEEASKKRSQVQPNRKCKRPRIQLRYRYLNNRKSCI